MIIGIHSVAAFKPHKTGVEKYAKRLVENMAMLPEAKEHRFILYTNKQNQSTVTERIKNQDLPENFYLKILKFPFLWTQIRLAAHFIFKKPDAFFVPAHVLPIISHPKNSTVMIHDIAFELFPEAYPLFHRKYLRFTTKYALKHAEKIIVPSESTKQDILRFYKWVDEKKIFVVYHGMEYKLLDLKFSEAPLNFPYFLYIGRLEFKKNILGILRAFDLFKAQYKSTHKLVLAGGLGFGGEKIKEMAAKHRFKNDIILTGFISEEKKENLFVSADIFLFPSLYEGFGFPILEAQAFGVPVITSCISSMPEVSGEGAILVNPHKPEEIKDAIIRILIDESLRKNLIVKGRENLKIFSWQNCARETLRIITD
ncbi:MAG: hypothetical protein US61_C0001G0013 [Parcubacteria group bacterium GW2011_GWE2_37_8]|nr:MAG: hypothetical protein US61_C0001G0013 [Parcubacteria group bacterium GW2011_GWE2_37_8]